MNINEYLTVTAIMGGVATVLGWWLKTRLDNSIKHEYDRLLELFKAEQKRSDILLSERLAAFKVLSEKLIALRRYCHARSAELRNESEFEPRTDALSPAENISLLMHHELIQRALEERELFVSPTSRNAFDRLFSQMGMGFNIELLFSSETDDPVIDGVKLNTYELYDLVAKRVNDVSETLYSDLEFPEKAT
jgi:hypothetical protein